MPKKKAKVSSGRQGIMLMKAIKPVITKCEVTDCAFNGNNLCHAMAINVGDEHQQCDTYTASRVKEGATGIKGGVGACKVVDCEFNKHMLCGAAGITVSRHGAHADCGTFMKNPAL